MQSFKERFKNIGFDRPLFAPKVRTSMDIGGQQDTRYKGPHQSKKLFVPTDFEPHQLFLVIDGQDLFGKSLDFCYFEIAQYLASLIPRKLWNKESEKLNLYERLMIAAPAMIS